MGTQDAKLVSDVCGTYRNLRRAEHFANSTRPGFDVAETEAALARYQEDRDLSVTGTLNPATLRSLGLAPTRN